MSDDKQFDDVQRPEHYNTHPSGIECVEINENFSGNLAAAIKYVWRKDLKEPIPLRDLQKAEWYLKREIERVTHEREWAIWCIASRIAPLRKNMAHVIATDDGLLGQVLTALLSGELGRDLDRGLQALRAALSSVQEAIRAQESSTA